VQVSQTNGIDTAGLILIIIIILPRTTDGYAIETSWVDPVCLPLIIIFNGTQPMVDQWLPAFVLGTRSQCVDLTHLNVANPGKQSLATAGYALYLPADRRVQ
jgi:hypothetical protein